MRNEIDIKKFFEALGEDEIDEEGDVSSFQKPRASLRTISDLSNLLLDPFGDDDDISGPAMLENFINLDDEELEKIYELASGNTDILIDALLNSSYFRKHIETKIQSYHELSMEARKVLKDAYEDEIFP